MVGRGRGFLDTHRSVAPGPGCNLKVTVASLAVSDSDSIVAKREVSAEKEDAEKQFKDWNPMKDDYNNPAFNSYTGGLGMELSASQSRSPQGVTRGGAPEPGRNLIELYITGIPRDLSDEGLKKLFSRAGEVKKAKVMDTKMPEKKGTFGFVGFEKRDEVQRAIQQLDNFVINNSTLRVQLSRTKEEKEALAKKQAAEAAALAGASNSPSSYGRVASSGYESGYGSKPSPRNSSNGYESSGYGPPKNEKPVRTGDRGGGDAKPKPVIVQSSEPIEAAPCIKCGKTGNFRCKNCKASYCGVECQRDDWKARHRKICGKQSKTYDSGNDSNKENSDYRPNIIASGPLKGFDISFPGDGELEASPSPPPPSQAKRESRIMIGDVGRERLPEGKCQMVLSNISSSLSLTFCPLKTYDQLEELRARMQQIYGKFKEDSCDVYVPVVDEVVAAYFDMDNSWNRALVIEVADGKAGVKYVDYGNRSRVPLSKLRRGHECFKKLKFQGITTAFADYVYEKHPLSEDEHRVISTALVFSEMYNVTFAREGSTPALPLIHLELKNGTDVGRVLADAGVLYRQTGSGRSPVKPSDQGGKPALTPQSAFRNRQNSSGSGGSIKSPGQQNGDFNQYQKSLQPQNGPVQPTTNVPNASSSAPQSRAKPEVASTTEQVTSQTSADLEPFNPEKPGYLYPTVAKDFYPGCEIVIQVINVEDTRFWIQEVSKCGFLDELTQSLTAYYGQKAPKKDFKPSKNCLVAARFPAEAGGDGNFYRAHISEFTPEGVLHVRYLDYANVAQISYRDIHNLEGNDLKDEFQAVPVHLAGVAPDQSWSPEIQGLFAQLVGGLELKAKVVSSTSHYAVIDITLPDNRMLRDVMLEAGLKKAGAVQKSPTAGTPAVPKPTKAPQVVPVAKAVTLNPFDLKDRCMASVSYGESSINDFYLVADHELLQTVMTSFGTVHEVGHERYKPQREGEFVTVLSAMFQEYYRAQVLKLEGSTARVYYVDYGNEETVDVDNVTRMLPKLEDIPMLAVPCTLGVDIKPGKTIDPKQLDGPWEVKIKSKEGSRYVVDLFRDEQSVVESLINQGLVREKGEQESKPVPNAKKSFVVPPAVEPAQLNVPLDVVVTDATQFSSLYLQFFDQESGLKTAELATYLQTEFANAPCLETLPREGDFVVAKFSEDDNWYRAVVSRVGDGNARVQFVDYGNGETVNFTKMAEIDKTAAECEVRAVSCRLQGVTLAPGKQWDPSSIPVFVPMSAVFLKCVDESYEVKLSTPEGEDLSEYLVAQGIGVRATAAESSKESAKKPADVPKTPAKLPPIYNPSRIDAPLPVEMIGGFPSCEEIYIRVNEEALTLCEADLTKKMHDTYIGKDNPSVDVSVGDFIVAKFSEDQNYYRAVVRDIAADGITVTFVDYGNDDKVTLKDITTLTPELHKFPRLAWRCSLDVVQNPDAEWPPAELAHVTQVLIKEFSSDSTTIIDLLLADGKSLRSELIARNVVKVRGKETPKEKAPARRSDLFYEKDMPPTIVQPKQLCHIIHVNSSTDFYVQVKPDDTAKDILTDYLASYSEDKAKDPSSRLSASQAIPGLLVAAKYDVDQTYYRGVLRRLESDGSWNVLFIDFGNSERVKVNGLIPLDKKLLSVPPSAVRVSQLFGVEDQSQIPQSGLETCEEHLVIQRAERLGDGSFKVALTYEDGRDFAKSLLGSSGAAGDNQGADSSFDKGQIDAMLQKYASSPELLQYLKQKLNAESRLH